MAILNIDIDYVECENPIQKLIRVEVKLFGITIACKVKDITEVQ